MKTLKEISKTGIPNTKWCLEEDVKKMFNDYNKKLKENLFGGAIRLSDNEMIEEIEQLLKEVLGE